MAWIGPGGALFSVLDGSGTVPNPASYGNMDFLSPALHDNISCIPMSPEAGPLMFPDKTYEGLHFKQTMGQAALALPY